MYSDVTQLSHAMAFVEGCNALASIKCILTGARCARTRLYRTFGCNALASIKCILTLTPFWGYATCWRGCNALASIKCILTPTSEITMLSPRSGCNALASIKCILTQYAARVTFGRIKVVMPLRALSVF